MLNALRNFMDGLERPPVKENATVFRFPPVEKHAMVLGKVPVQDVMDGKAEPANDAAPGLLQRLFPKWCPASMMTMPTLCDPTPPPPEDVLVKPTEEGAQPWGWLTSVLVTYLVVIMFGTFRFEDKWHKVPGDGWDYQKPGEDVAKDSITCDSSADALPCFYAMLNPDQQFLFFFLAPLAPWLLSVATEFHVQGSDAWNRKNEARRLAEFGIAFLVFWAYTSCKIQLQYELDVTFDPSNVVTASMVGTAILLKEVGIVGLALTMRSLSICLVALSVWVYMAYYSFYDCASFHTPAETFVGVVFGLLLVGLWVNLLITMGPEGDDEDDEDEESQASYLPLPAGSSKK
mmetsp:Transcript_44464/g.80505  ORF Transcript_44464/g.80505 Transcript_44464/m.80505 type:complete len:346 (-) Transcript_44464:75-1112(-)|eukprot:CAMPEP_0115051622 /NCGR_PEP_ID=MMETSP0227-20121206/2450_1 /TAXON_ID=89957 /ORGANISM="Polarella glacialis, Strain CCMP 1383" /LENGTH=345 /DNA_ID=CAMNT_0002435625 /DNA_START=39 /DNA_END=1076 /DNA_ORIENTATION=+